jgi:glyceraldehyde 3-phosphate dehydrogenase
LPALAGRLQCFSYRVPTSQVTSAELLLVLERAARPEDVLHCLRERHRLTTGTRLFEFCDDPLVSVDFAGNRHSAVVDTRWLVHGHANTVRLVLWYDNEWGYAAKVVDAIDFLAGAG